MKDLFVVPTRDSLDGLLESMKAVTDGREGSDCRIYSGTGAASIRTAMRIAEGYGAAPGGAWARGRAASGTPVSIAEGCGVAPDGVWEELDGDSNPSPFQLESLYRRVQQEGAGTLILVASPAVAGMYALVQSTRDPFKRNNHDPQLYQTIHFDYGAGEYETIHP